MKTRSKRKTSPSVEPSPLKVESTINFSIRLVRFLLGSCVGIVIRTGDQTFIGRIANLTAGIQRGKTPINIELQHFIRLITVFAVIVGLIFSICSLTLGYTYIEAVVFLISVIVAQVPEGKPI